MSVTGVMSKNGMSDGQHGRWCFARAGVPVLREEFHEQEGRTLLCASGARCTICYIGDCTPYQMAATAAAHRASGMIAPKADLLFDFTRYTGMIDWEYVKALPQMPLFIPPPAKAAYVVKDEHAGLTIKGLTAFVTRTECRIFTAFGDAMAWLEWKSPEGRTEGCGRCSQP